MSPILWSNEELREWCLGSPVVHEAAERLKALEAEWENLQSDFGSKLPEGFTKEAFLDAFSVVLCYAFYLPKAGRFALLPSLTGIQRTGDETACTLDYNPETDTVILTAQKDYKS